MTEMTFNELSLLEGFLAKEGRVILGEEQGLYLFALARRALEQEAASIREGELWGRVNALAEKVLEQPAPTGEVTREHRGAAANAITQAAWGDWHDRRDAIAQLLATREQAAYNRGRQEAQGGWVAVADKPPEFETLAWIVWEGTVQEQPWVYLDRHANGPAWHYDESRITDGVSHYMPIAPPPPPSDTRKGGR